MASRKTSAIINTLALLIFVCFLKYQTLVPPKIVPPKPVKLKRIVLWNSFFGRSEWYTPFPSDTHKKMISCEDNTRCVLSAEKTNPLSYDALVFHGRDPQNPPLQRNPSQIYIMYLWESPWFRGGHFIKGDFYNWSSTYSKKSDLTMKHGWWAKLPQNATNAMDKLPPYAKRPKNSTTIAWVVSHCGAASGRDAYVTELKRHIKVDVYGRCGKPCPGGTGGNSVNCYDRIAKTGQYKFYLAFENSNCEDYISLKPYRALNSSMVPIVLGGKHAKDYIGVFPPNSYIDVRNFTSPKKLAEYVKVLDDDDGKYLAYHAWRKDFYVHEGFGDLRAFCQICKALYDPSKTKPKTVNWGSFWNKNTMCDANLVRNLLGKGN